jgi:hypothetical protein
MYVVLIYTRIFQTPISAPEYSIQSVNVKNVKSSDKVEDTIINEYYDTCLIVL